MCFAAARDIFVSSGTVESIMNDDSDKLLINRFAELAHRAYSRECYVCSDFLNVAEQALLNALRFDKASAPYELLGGYEAAERRLACFGDEGLCGYIAEPPISCIEIAPLSAKFAGALTHRDFLGSLMALGLKRGVLGDIVLDESAAYLFCLESFSDYITDNLNKAANTAVKCSKTQIPDIVSRPPDISRVNVASERLDAMLASVYRLSRSESQRLIISGRVFINGKATENLSLLPDSGAIISVRGLGRFKYEGIDRTTRKGRLEIHVRVF